MDESNVSMKKIVGEPLDNSQKPSNIYEEESKALEEVAQRFGEVLRRFETITTSETIGQEIQWQKEQFENSFLALNCEIQQVRSDNELLVDAVRNRETKLKNLDKEIKEKGALVNLIEKKILDLKNIK